MVVVYNDEDLKYFSSAITGIMWDLNTEILKVCDREYYGYRVNTTKIKDYLNKKLKDYGYKYEILDKPFHLYGIGNNCRYEVALNLDKNERIICGYININDLIYGNAIVYFEDLQNRKCYQKFKITEKGVDL